MICTLALCVIIRRCSGSSVSRLTRLVGAGPLILGPGEAGVTASWDTGALTSELALPVTWGTWPRARNEEKESGWGWGWGAENVLG